MFHKKMRRRALRVRKKFDTQTIQSGKQRLGLRDKGLLPSSIHVSVQPTVGERDLDCQRAGATREFIGYLQATYRVTYLDGHPIKKTRLIKSQQLFPGTLSI